VGEIVALQAFTPSDWSCDEIVIEIDSSRSIHVEIEGQYISAGYTLKSCYVLEVRKFYDLYISREKDLRVVSSARSIEIRCEPWPQDFRFQRLRIRSFVFSSYVCIPPTLPPSLSLSLWIANRPDFSYLLFLSFHLVLHFRLMHS